MCKELDEIIQKTEHFLVTEDSLDNSTEVAVWWKDRDLRFIRYNNAMCKFLYPKADLNALIGKTDWEYARDSGCSTKLVNRIKQGCSTSDYCLLNSNEQCIHFYEKCRVVGTSKDIWLHTVKTRIPPESKGCDAVGVYGAAFKDEIAGLMIERGMLSNYVEKLSETCYKILKYY